MEKNDAQVFEIGDIVRDGEGRRLLVAWSNILRDGSMAPTVPVLVLGESGEDVDCIDIETASIAKLEQKAAFSFDETRRRFWTFLASHQ